MTNQLATTNTNLPAFIAQDNSDLGIDVLGNEDVVTPRLKICQPLSRGKDDNAELKDGDIYNSGTAEVIGNPIEMYILSIYKSRVWYSKDQKMIGYESENPRTKQITRFGDEINEICADKNRYNEGKGAYNYMVVLAKDLKPGVIPTVYIYSAESAAQGPGRKLNTLLKASAQRGAPLYSNKVVMGSEKVKFDNGNSAFMPTFGLKGFCDEQAYPVLKEGYEFARKELDKGDVHREEQAPVSNQAPTGNHPASVENPFNTEA